MNKMRSEIIVYEKSTEVSCCRHHSIIEQYPYKHVVGWRTYSVKCKEVHSEYSSVYVCVRRAYRACQCVQREGGGKGRCGSKRRLCYRLGESTVTVPPATWDGVHTRANHLSQCRVAQRNGYPGIIILRSPQRIKHCVNIFKRSTVVCSFLKCVHCFIYSCFDTTPCT